MLSVQQTFHTSHFPNFEFLTNTFPELFRLASEMEYYYSQDHSCALLKARLFAEVWCYRAADYVNIKLTGDSELSHKITQLKQSLLLPDYMIDELNLIREYANHGVHVSQVHHGALNSVVSVSKAQVKMVHKSVFELAHFLSFQLANEKNEPVMWQEPILVDTVCNVSLALNDNPDANLALAEQAYFQLSSIKKASKIIQQPSNKKAYNQLNKIDLAYWIERAHALKALGTWQLYAQAFEHKFLVESQTMNTQYCYKQAIKECRTGESHFLYANFLSTTGEMQRAWTLAEESAKRGYHQAIVALQKKYYKSDISKYNYWVEQGIKYKEINSFTVDAANKLELWLIDQENDLAKKRARTALITAQATQAPGSQYLKALCDYFGYWGKQPKKECVNGLIKTYKNLPLTIHYQTRLFNILKNHSNHRKLAIEMGCLAIKLGTCKQSQPQLKFDLAMQIRDELAGSGQVKSSFMLKTLIKESANQGCEKAIQFLKLPIGKALIRDNSIIGHTSTFKQPNRKKQKVAKKQAKKARKK